MRAEKYYNKAGLAENEEICMRFSPYAVVNLNGTN